MSEQSRINLGVEQRLTRIEVVLWLTLALTVGRFVAPMLGIALP